MAQDAEVRAADFDADGRCDLALNAKDGPTNVMYYAFSTDADTFAVSGASMHGTSVQEGWQEYATLVGSFNDDPLWDLGWSYVGTRNKTWYGLSDGVGNVDFAPLMERVEGGWFGFVTVVLDIDGDGIDDVAWNETTSNENRLFAGITDVFGFLDMRPAQSFDAGDWSGFDVARGDLNGDGRGDLVWSAPAPPQTRIYVAQGRADGGFDLSAETVREAIGDAAVEFRVGDVDGDGSDDLVWVAGPHPGASVYVSLSRAGGTFEHRDVQRVATPCAGTCALRMGDFNGDGHADLAWNALGSENVVGVVLGDASGNFANVLAAQEHTSVEDWASYTWVTGDVDGNGTEDLIWVRPTAEARVFVARASRTPGSRAFAEPRAPLSPR